MKRNNFPARVIAFLLRAFILVYRYTLASLFGGACRFVPSCSAYALEAVERHGALRGTALAARRLCRCHPWGGHGFDPVPERHNNNNAMVGTAGDT